MQSSHLLNVYSSPEADDVKISLATFLVLTLLLPALIVIGNFVIGVLTPLTAGADDDMTLVDSVWRLVQGQHLGQDFMIQRDLVCSKWAPFMAPISTTLLRFAPVG
ncbi:MAG: hypothetical protein JO266_11530 [Acidobacteria bacterium]|nr:hypothetical protein [Acidobacteriota bacterium]